MKQSTEQSDTYCHTQSLLSLLSILLTFSSVLSSLKLLTWYRSFHPNQKKSANSSLQLSVLDEDFSFPMLITIAPPDPTWVNDFLLIKSELEAALRHEDAEYLSIEHIGSTAIPHLPAKPVIDIVIVIQGWTGFDKIEQAMNFGGMNCLLPSYVCEGPNGIRERMSFKLHDPDRLPKRNVYVQPAHSLNLRAQRDLLRILKQNPGLRNRYAWVKMRLASQGEYEDVMQYAQAKDTIIREILGMASWSEKQIREKEGMVVRDWEVANQM